MAANMDMDLDSNFATQEHPVVLPTTEFDPQGLPSSSRLRPPASPGLSLHFQPPGKGLLNSQTSYSQFGSGDGRQSPPISPAVDLKIVPKLPRPTYLKLPYATGRTGLVYDVRMRFHLDPTEGEEAHPERPRRIMQIFQELCDAGLAIAPDDPIPDDDPSQKHKLVRIQIRAATAEEICLVHSRAHVEFVMSLDTLPMLQLAELTAKGDSIYYHPLSWIAASLSAGGAIEATRAVVGGLVRNAVAIIRPPGHHAEHGEASGFCFFNNVCVAAKVVQREFPETCRKVLIMDWDVHHGNGIQQAFESDPNVLYISTHVYRNATFYPQTTYGDHLHCGLGEGLGRNVNIPWAEQGMTDADYMLAFQQIVMPIATEFDPDLVIIAAGFDAAEGDELGGCHVSPAGYSHMTHMLMQLAKGKIVACLEGGYNLDSIARSATAMTRVFMGEPPERLGELTPTNSAVVTVQKVIRTQAAFWKCMYPKNFQLAHKHSLGSERLHDIIREWQSKVMWEQYGMSEMFVLRPTASRSFKNQVLATRNYAERCPLLVIFHDPPESHGYPDPRTNKLELHNTWLTYVDWAVKCGFAVIDINVPKHITEDQDTTEYADADAESMRAASARDIAMYIWTNYVELASSTHIFLLGIGDAYSGILDLLSKHPSAVHNVNLTTCFIATHALRSVQKASDDDVARWFHARSMIFVSPEHAALDPARSKKLKRRYGNVIRGKATHLQDMLVEHREEVCARMEGLCEGWQGEDGDGDDDDDHDDNGGNRNGTRGAMDEDPKDGAGGLAAGNMAIR